MPLSRRQFDAGEADPALAALDFLFENSDLAFSFEEIVSALEDASIVVNRKLLRRGLLRLKVAGRIESRSVGSAVCYRYRKTLGFRR